MATLFSKYDSDAILLLTDLLMRTAPSPLPIEVAKSKFLSLLLLLLVFTKEFKFHQFVVKQKVCFI